MKLLYHCSMFFEVPLVSREEKRRQKNTNQTSNYTILVNHNPSIVTSVLFWCLLHIWFMMFCLTSAVIIAFCIIYHLVFVFSDIHLCGVC